MHRLLIPALAWLTVVPLLAQQRPVARIEQMPLQPTPYQMRDWKAIAKGYDAFVFDFEKQGQHLPLGWIDEGTVNYPDDPSFGLVTYVGTNNPALAEAINVLPALVGATLVGIDKRDQAGRDWVRMSREYFNRRPAENVYLNLPVTHSGIDWWYETMPNVFFYQLYDLYPGVEGYDAQFATVAARWWEAVEAMGGSTTPWAVPSMRYRAWSLSEMKPNRDGVPEPEAAGAIAWLLYHAYTVTGEERFRIGAEWAMEFLVAQATNPSYELQLAYGAYIAARMNAELGTDYDVGQLVDWCFAVGPLRNWGAIVGTWGGYDVHGLIGEVSANDYAFMMNTYQQVGALVPLVRYDDRFARAIGQWVLHAANASRLFYTPYLPTQNQDGEDWSMAYDPEAYIGHEALRKESFGQTPYATGDAVKGGWAQTNFALYGSSHVGYLAGIVDTTDVPMILQLDARKTDFFQRAAYPTYLYFNPYATSQTVTVDVGAAAVDLYNAVSNRFVATNEVGAVSLALAPEEAALVVLVPAGGAVEEVGNQLLVDGVVVDFDRGLGRDPALRIKALAAAADTVLQQASVELYCTPAGAASGTYAWDADAGSLSGSGSRVTWTAPPTAGSYEIRCSVRADAAQAEAAVTVVVIDNLPPTITALDVPAIVARGAAVVLHCAATDPDSETLRYTWTATAGHLSASNTAQTTWSAPDEAAYVEVACGVDDGEGGTAVQTRQVVVGHLVLALPLAGSAADTSGFGHAGAIMGALPTEDRTGNEGHAYAFDGFDDHVRIPSHPTLDFEEAMTLVFWVKRTATLGREAFLVSHGSWQNRWKVSLLDDQRLRWTVNTTTQIYDLDTITPLALDRWYQVAATFGPGAMRLYLDGEREAERAAQGTLRQTTLDLTLAQMVPGDTQFNFAGALDAVHLYNRALTEGEVQTLYERATDRSHRAILPESTQWTALFPNPFARQVHYQYTLRAPSEVKVRVYDLLGRQIWIQAMGRQEGGAHHGRWDGRDASGHTVAPGVYLLELQAGSTRVRRLVIKA